MEELDYIQKGSNKVNGQYNFVSHDQVTAKIHPLLVKHRVLAIPTVKSITQEGNRTKVELVVCFFNVDNPVDAFTVEFPGYGVDLADKGPGKAISYAFKYALLKTFCLETGDDPDNDTKSVYEAVKCLEFDLLLPEDLTQKDKERLNNFLSYSAEAMKKHVEDVKREAVNRMPEFMKAFKNWKPKKKGEE